MIYLINGDEPYLIENKLKEIVSENKDATLTKFDGNSKSLMYQEVVEACTSIGLFMDKSLVLVKDPQFLIKKQDEDEIKLIIDYCNKPIYENTLVFYTLENKFNTRLKVFKDISSNAQLITLNKIEKKDFYNYAISTLKENNLKMNKDAFNYLVNNCNCDAGLLNRNIEVLKLYPEQIDLLAVNKLISLPNEEDVFSLINAICNKELSKAIACCNKLLVIDDSILGLIALLASQLRFLYCVSYYKGIGKSIKEIADITKSKEYRITKSLETLNNLKDVDILNLLSKLSDLDYKCKTQYDISEKLNLELLIISLIK